MASSTNSIAASGSSASTMIPTQPTVVAIPSAPSPAKPAVKPPANTKMLAALAALALLLGLFVVFLLLSKNNQPNPPASDVVASPVNKKIKTVIISKSTPASTTSDYQLNLGELEMYNGATKINLRAEGNVKASSHNLNSTEQIQNLIDGSPSTYAVSGDGDHEPKFTYTFLSPQTVTKIVVYNRHNCCWERAAGATLKALDDTGTVVLSATLTGQKEPQTFNVSA